MHIDKDFNEEYNNDIDEKMKGVSSMLSDEKKKEIQDLTENYLKLPELNRIIIKSNIDVLVASQEAQKKQRVSNLEGGERDGDNYSAIVALGNS